jgi:hypothetical protein
MLNRQRTHWIGAVEELQVTGALKFGAATTEDQPFVLGVKNVLGLSNQSKFHS